MGIVIVSALCILILLLVLRLFKRQRHLPPGPPKWPIIGSIHQVPLKEPWIRFGQWRQDYGDVVHLGGLGNSIVILNSFKAVNDLLDKRGNTYSDRPVLIVAGELMGLDKGTGFRPPDKDWRIQRKLSHIALSPESVKKFYSLQEEIAALFTQAVLKQPEEFVSYTRHAAGRIIMSFIYGLPVDDPYYSKYITHAEATAEVTTKALVPGAYLVDAFHMLKHLPKWFPFTSFFKDGARGRKMVDELFTSPFLHVKKKMKDGNALPCLVQELLADSELKHDDHFEENVRLMSGTLYAAGVETTYATVLTFIMLMALNPVKQRLLQAEIDRVIGSGRLPVMGDCPSLPYLEAAIKETMRWNPVLPLSLARRTSQDDYYEQYFIPSGTIVFPNVWAISRDCSSKYPPDDFVPERFLEENPPLDPYLYVFGFGRRVCPGKYLGESSVFIIVVTLLSVFDVSLPLDEKGSVESLDVSFTSGLISYPERFRCTIKSRSESREKLVHTKVMQRAK